MTALSKSILRSVATFPPFFLVIIEACINVFHYQNKRRFSFFTMLTMHRQSTPPSSKSRSHLKLSQGSRPNSCSLGRIGTHKEPQIGTPNFGAMSGSFSFRGFLPTWPNTWKYGLSASFIFACTSTFLFQLSFQSFQGCMQTT